MKKEIKDKWIKALRSGEFTQGKGFLEKKGRYCALGVLSLLSLGEGQCTWNQQGEVGRYDNKRFTLSHNTMVWAGIGQKEERFLEPGAGRLEFSYKGKLTSILELNDMGLTFMALAKIIEKHWEKF